jgi:hypothetical protein
MVLRAVWIAHFGRARLWGAVPPLENEVRSDRYRLCARADLGAGRAELMLELEGRVAALLGLHQRVQ